MLLVLLEVQVLKVRQAQRDMMVLQALWAAQALQAVLVQQVLQVQALLVL